jgi:tripartite-type tricarboxylate transporter receptor subunit TctC
MISIRHRHEHFPAHAATAEYHQVRTGNLRALDVTGSERWPTLPDVPTIGETVPRFSGTS